MIPIIDFSLFSTDEFQRGLHKKSDKTSSLLIYDGNHSNLDSLFVNKSSLWNYIHDQFRYCHDAYIPFIPSPEYLNQYSYQLKAILDPFEKRIKNKMVQMEGADIDKYFNKSSDWIPFLFTDREQLDYGCQLVRQIINCNHQSPFLILWTNYQSKEVITITIPNEHLQLEKYYKAVFASLRGATKSLLQKSEKINADRLKGELTKYLRRDSFFQKQTNDIPIIDIIQLKQPFRNILREVGKSCGEHFQDAIANYGNYPEKNKFKEKYSTDSTLNIERDLRKSGFELIRRGKHNIYSHPNLKKRTPVPRHNQQSPSTIRSIKRDIHLAALSDLKHDMGKDCSMDRKQSQ